MLRVDGADTLGCGIRLFGKRDVGMQALAVHPTIATAPPARIVPHNHR